MNEQQFIEKPEGKPVKAFRARVKMYGNDVVVVNPETRAASTSRRARKRALTLSTSTWMQTIPILWQRCRSSLRS